MRTDTPIFLVVLIAFASCNGIEADVSKKLDFDISLSDPTYDNVLRDINIREHDEIDDYIDYAAYPDVYRLNSVSYEISSVEVDNLATTIDLNVSYRNATLDTIPLFEVFALPVVVSDRIEVSVNQNDIETLTNLLNTQVGRFDLYVEAESNDENFNFILKIYFDTTVAIDYDL